MHRTPVRDLPVRTFHWLLAGGFTAAALIAFLIDDEAALFPYHGVIGLVLALLVLLRIGWGFVGTRYARFSSLPFRPRDMLEYVRGAAPGHGGRFAVHNPGAAYAALAMLGLVLGLAVTGVLMARGNKSAKDIHEIMAWSMLVVVGIHLLGVLIYTLRFRENIARTMVDGCIDVEPSQGIRSARPLAAVAMIVVTGVCAIGLLRSYAPDSKALTVPFLGTLQLGELKHKRTQSHEVPGSNDRNSERTDRDADDHD